jgi:Vanadium chloroperoxidase N-terminal domain/PAP2 superfamily
MPTASEFWNDVALDANKEDHSHTAREAGGPVYSARALAMVHAAMADAYANAHGAGGGGTPFMPAFVTDTPPGVALPEAALGGAAHAVLSAIHTWQRPAFDARRDAFLSHLLSLPGNTPQAVQGGWDFGQAVGQAMLALREHDGSADPTNSNDASGYAPTGLNGMHAPDPLNPGQGFYGWHFGKVVPFVLEEHEALEMMPPPPPQTHEKRHLDDLAEVYVKGRKDPLGGRTQQQTDIGVFWAYDGVPGIGTPPRLYNQILREVCEAEPKKLTETDWVTLLARFHLALADAGIVAWQAKYLYNVWRPVVGIREHVPIPSRPDAPKDPSWVPLGAPASNGDGDGRERKDFTPPFPAYPSGHATFGAAGFTVLRRFLRDHRDKDADGKKDDGNKIDLNFTSDELNGVTKESDGVTPRPESPQFFPTIDDLIEKNLESRVWLGVHWFFDGELGANSGAKVGRKVAEAVYQTT